MEPDVPDMFEILAFQTHFELEDDDYRAFIPCSNMP